MKQQHSALPVAHRFLPGNQDDAPLLVPVACSGKEARTITAFCRRIYPGAPILATSLAPTGGTAKDHALAQRLTQLIRRAGRLYDLTLTPVVLVGQNDAVELVTQIASRCAADVTACILLRPTRSAAALPVGSLTGLAVLLAYGAEDTSANIGQALRRLLAAAGAEVVTTRVRSRSASAGNNVTVCRVFLETIFAGGRDTNTG